MSAPSEEPAYANGAEEEPSAAAEAPRIGDFEVLEKLGQGGMGAVYAARQLPLDRIVALKILPPDFAQDGDYVHRFRREATLAASLNHPNLVRVYASGEADGYHYFAMELVEGENLRQYLKRTGPLPPPEAVRISLEVARALQHGWERAQLIHRDVKPSNIYLSAAGAVKLGDLGLAKSALSEASAITQTGTAIGTPHYVSPEQARGERELDFRADIYSLGCTLYELLTGSPPYRASDPLSVMTMHLTAPLPAIQKVLPQCPLPLVRLLNKMLRKSKHERQQGYSELIAAMEQALGALEHPRAANQEVVEAWKQIGKAGGAAPATVHASGTTSRRSGTRSRLPMIGAAAALLGAGGVAWFVFTPRADAPVSEPAPTAAPTVESPAAEKKSAALQWRDLTTLAIATSGVRAADGWLTSSQPRLIFGSVADAQEYGFRATFKGSRAPGAAWPVLMFDDGANAMRLEISAGGDKLTLLTRRPDLPDPERALGEISLSPPLTAGRSYQMELYVTGRCFVARCDRQTLVANKLILRGEHRSQPGIDHADADAFSAPAVLQLGDLSEADALKSAGLSEAEIARHLAAPVSTPPRRFPPGRFRK